MKGNGDVPVIITLYNALLSMVYDSAQQCEFPNTKDTDIVG